MTTVATVVAMTRMVSVATMVAMTGVVCVATVTRMVSVVAVAGVPFMPRGHTRFAVNVTAIGIVAQVLTDSRVTGMVLMFVLCSHTLNLYP
nr:hypothetical protein [Brevibacterium sp. UCMA 11752]